MIPLFICFVVIIYLLRYDVRRRPNVSHALWVPSFWFMIYSSRALSSWFGFGIADPTSDYYLEGNPFDRTVFIALIIAGSIILLRRRPPWGTIFESNKFIFLYILYLGVSTLWSDYTFVSFKRWIKELGHLIMILIVLTEDSPVEAVRTIITRSAYVLIPLSWVLNRYFPELSRFYSVGGGDPQFTGVTTNKNSLGTLCLVASVVLFWDFLTEWYQRTARRFDKDLLIYTFLFLLVAWLLYSAKSATSLAGTLTACLMILALSSNRVRGNPGLIGYYAITSVFILITAHLFFDLTSLVTSSLGRDETLTGRTDFWKELIAFGTNPLIGTGYESFWLGERVAYFWDRYWWRPNQAHNGYLELYLNLGLAGLTLFILLVAFSFRNIKRNIELFHNYDYQILRITFIVVALLINVTEAYFKGAVWFVFLLSAMEPPNTFKRNHDYLQAVRADV